MCKATLISLICFNLLFLRPAFVNANFPPDKDLRGQYYEGLRPYINVSAGTVKLLSCLATRSTTTSSGSSFHLSFQLPPSLVATPLEIFIEDRSHQSYYMMPVQKIWPTGQNVFAWSSNFATEHGIMAKNLLGLAKPTTKERGNTTIVPLIIYMSDPPKGNIQFYEFTFIATRKASFKYSVLDDHGDVVYKSSVQDQLSNKPVTIRWRPQTALPGEYTLVVNYQLSNGQIVSGQAVYRFYHTM